jgi:hypothetical protein
MARMRLVSRGFAQISTFMKLMPPVDLARPLAAM